MFEINIEEQAAEHKGDFQIIPEGWVKMRITTGEMKDTSTGGKMLVLTLECGQGSFPDRLNVVNKSPKAQAIGLSQLAKICQVCGLDGNFKAQDIPKLFGRELDVKVKVESFKGNKKNDQGEYPTLKSNKAANYAPAGEKSSLANATPTATPADAPAATEGNPW